jgi:hypothetical protein
MTLSPSLSWNSPLIDSIFMQSEGDLIKQLPLFQNPTEDKLMWPHTTDGCYSVRSGYNILKQWQENRNCNSASPNTYNKIWTRLWSLHTIPRHKALIWRVANNALPVRSALNQRGVNCPILCPRCMIREETISHLFMGCDRAAHVWFGSNLGVKFTSTILTS